MAPESENNEPWSLFNTMNGNGGELSAEAAGIAVCLMAYSHHACRTECDAMTEHYYRLRDYPQSRLFPFCTGKYKWSGSICHYAGQEVQDISGVLAVFAERRQSRNGPYVVLRSVTLN